MKREDVHLRATINKTNEFSLAWNLRGHREMRPHVRGVVMCSCTSTLRTTLESLARDFTCARLANAVLLRLTGVGLMGSIHKSGSVSTCAARRKTRGNPRSSQSTSVAFKPWSHQWHSSRTRCNESRRHRTAQTSHPAASPPRLCRPPPPPPPFPPRLCRPRRPCS